MEEGQEKQSDRVILFVGWLMIAIGGLGRYVFSVTMPEIIIDKGFLNAEAGLISGGVFLAYAIMQLATAKKFRQLPMRIVISAGVMISAVTIIMTPFARAGGMFALSIINGLSNAMLYMVIIEFYSCYMSPAKMGMGELVASTGANVTRLLLYGIASLCSALLSWEWTFFISAFLMTIVSFVWFFYARRFPRLFPSKKIEDVDESSRVVFKDSIQHKNFVRLYWICLFSSLSSGFIKRVLDVWFPTILKNFYGLSSTITYSIMIGTVILGIFAALMAKELHHFMNNIAVLTGIIYCILAALGALVGVGLANNGVLLFLIIGSIELLLSYCAGSIVILFSMECRKYISSGTFFALVNAFGCAGICVCDYGVGRILDALPWQSVFFVVSVVSVFSAVMMLLSKHSFEMI